MDALLFVLLSVGAGTFVVAAIVLRSLRRSEHLGEQRYNLLQDQHDRLELLHEERRTLMEELDRESEERRRLMDLLEGSQLAADPEQARRMRVENARRAEQQEQERARLQQEIESLQAALEREREAHLEIQQRVERLERARGGFRQEVERLRQDYQRLSEALSTEREERLETQTRAEQQVQELAHLERDLRYPEEVPDTLERPPNRESAEKLQAGRSWWRRPTVVVGLVLSFLVMWFASLVVALSLLSP